MILPNGTNPPRRHCEEDINSASRFDALVETIEIGQVRRVALNARDVAADCATASSSSLDDGQ